MKPDAVVLCCECIYFVKDQKPLQGGMCHRHPKMEGKAHDDWCGDGSKIDPRFKDFPEFDAPVVKKEDMEDFF